MYELALLSNISISLHILQDQRPAPWLSVSVVLFCQSLQARIKVQHLFYPLSYKQRWVLGISTMQLHLLHWTKQGKLVDTDASITVVMGKICSQSVSYAYGDLLSFLTIFVWVDSPFPSLMDGIKVEYLFPHSTINKYLKINFCL